MWSIVMFGKYKHAGKSLPQIIFADPDWFFWAVEEGAFAGKAALLSEAILLNVRARTIRIPNNANGNLVAEYLTDPLTGKFARMHIVSKDQPAHEGGSKSIRKPIIDLSIVRAISPYDKKGGAVLLSDVKLVLFGSRGARMTSERCETFFKDSKNFLP